MVESNDDWEITSVNSIPLSTASDWELLSDDRAFSDDDVAVLNAVGAVSSPRTILRRQRSSSADDASSIALDAEAEADAQSHSSSHSDEKSVASDEARAAAEAEIARLKAQLRHSQTNLQQAQMELETTHVEVADALASNTELRAQLDRQREVSERRIATLQADAQQQQSRINNLNRQLVVASLAPRGRRDRTSTEAMRHVQRKTKLTSAAVRSRPAKKWFQSHHHRSAYAQSRAPRGAKQAKRRGNDRY